LIKNKIDSVDIVEAEENLGALNADAPAMQSRQLMSAARGLFRIIGEHQPT
jgi:hypothetical protein